MRITQSIIARNLIQSINQNREKLNTLQTDIASGKELHQSSNDPINFMRASRFRNTISQNGQYLKNIVIAKGWVTTTAGLLDEFYSHVANAKDVAIQGADDTNSSEMRSALADRIDSILIESVSLANSKYLGKNVFSGTKTREDTPFVFDGTTITYNGNSGNITRRIDENLNISVNVPGSQLVDSNVFSSMIDLRDALNSNDADGIQTSIAAIESVSKQLLSLSAAVGSIRNQLNLTEQRLETANINLYSYLSQAEDVDMVEAITKYNAEEMAYRAALQITSDAIQVSLLDFLK